MLSNEEELLPLLDRAGFETIYPETLDFDQARQLLAEAAVILSIDGAALANLYMAPRSTRIGVIAVDGLPIPHYYFLASALGQPFTYLQGIPDHSSHENAAHRDVTLPARDLATFLDSL